MPAPNTPQDLIDRIRTLERRVEDLSGRVNIRPALNTIVGGSVTVKGGGALIVEDQDGDRTLTIGRVQPDVDGQPQQATVIRRMDGSLAFAVWTSATTGSQPIRMYDRGSNIIFADDLVAGGLAQPWLPLPSPLNDDVSTWAKASTTAYANVLRSRARLQHPKVLARIGIGLDSGVSGNLRLLINGTVVATGDTNLDLLATVEVPGWEWTGSPQEAEIVVQARRTAGTGSVYAQTRYVYGRQS